MQDTPKPPRIADSTSDFRRLITSGDIFVDKTMFIKELMDGRDETTLITRPRRWGKTTAFSMLRYFFSIVVNETGHAVEPNPHRVLFTGGAVRVDSSDSADPVKTLTMLKIASDETCMRAQGRWPVISVSFKDATENSYKKAKKEIEDTIAGAFKEHGYLRSSAHLTPAQLAQYSRHEAGNFTVTELKKSLLFLSQLLKAHHGTNVYIFVDEYDKPVNCFLEDGLVAKADSRTKVAKLMTSIMAACGKDNAALQKIVLTGITDSFKKEGRSGFNNVCVYGVQHWMYSGCFGFSEAEVSGMVQRLFCDREGVIGTVMSNIKAWYNGYKVVMAAGGSMHVYNPWAVMRYLFSASRDALIPESYWTESGSDKTLDTLGKTKIDARLLYKLKVLADGQEVDFNISPTFSLFKELSSDTQTESVIAYLLLTGGYISQGTGTGTFAVPNNEVMGYFRESVIPAWVTKEVEALSLGVVDAVCQAFHDTLSDAPQFTKTLRELLLKADPAHRSEADFQGLIGGLVSGYAFLKPSEARYFVLAEKPVIGGRIDHIFHPKDTSGPDAGGTVIIHEYKKLDRIKAGEVDALSLEALWQAFWNGYLSEPLAKRKHAGHTHRWTRVKVRAVVIFFDESTEKWNVEIKEIEFDQTTAIAALRFFSDALVKAELSAPKGAAKKVKQCNNKLLAAMHQLDTSISDLDTLLQSITTRDLVVALRHRKVLDHLSNKDRVDAVLEFLSQHHALEEDELHKQIQSQFSESIPTDLIALLTSSVAADHAASTLTSTVCLSPTDIGTMLRSFFSSTVAGTHGVLPAGYTDVAGDGHCFYHAVAHQLSRTRAVTSEQLLTMSIEHIQLNLGAYMAFLSGIDIPAVKDRLDKHQYQEAMQAYVAHHSRNGAWADSLMIQAMSNALNVNIVINMFNADGTPQTHTSGDRVGTPVSMVIQPNTGVSAITITLGSIANTHFVSHDAASMLAAGMRSAEASTADEMCDGNCTIAASFSLIYRAEALPQPTHIASMEPIITTNTSGVTHIDFVPPQISAFMASTNEFHRMLSAATPHERAQILSQALKNIVEPVLRIDTAISAFNSFVGLLNKGTESLSDLLYKARETLNHLLDTASPNKALMTAILLGMVDDLHDSSQVLPFAPHPGENPDDDPSGGGGDNSHSGETPSATMIVGGNTTVERSYDVDG